MMNPETKSQASDYGQSISEFDNFDIIRCATTKPVTSEELIKNLQSLPRLRGRLFLGYPIFDSNDEINTIDMLWVSPDYGVIAFDLIEGKDIGDYRNRQDNLAFHLENRLRREPRLRAKRSLKITLYAVSYLPRSEEQKTDVDYPVVNSQTLGDFLEKISPRSTNGEDWYALTRSVLDNIHRLVKRPHNRPVSKESSRGRKLNELENSIAALDRQQSKAVLETVEGVQRIRGLAGTGKTIVLALKAANLHAKHPEWNIRVTFLTRSLKNFYHQLIRDFHVELTGGSEPNWINLQILTAWGAPGGEHRNGIYHEFCLQNGVEWLDFDSAKRQFGRYAAFDDACQLALQQVTKKKALFDIILIDEAQDLPVNFMKLCYDSLRKPNRLVYAYDELQSLNRASLPPPEVIFGNNADGEPRVTLEQWASDPTAPTADIVLSRCYRTSRPILSTAHAIGFGIYRLPDPGSNTGIVQMFDDPWLWRAVGYEEESGGIEENKWVTLTRTPDSSPIFLEKHSNLDDLIVVKTFSSLEEQSSWIARSIERNILEDELRPNDILVINPDPLRTNQDLGPIQAKLMKLNIHSHFTGVGTDPDSFKRNGVESVTFSGIHRAKGNEAAMVYIANAEYGLNRFSNQARIRNQLFTAITRSKAWVRISGVGNNMGKLEYEYNQINTKNFKLCFRYPTEKERENLRTIQRAMSLSEQEQLNRGNEQVERLLHELENGTIDKENLNPELVQSLKEKL